MDRLRRDPWNVDTTCAFAVVGGGWLGVSARKESGQCIERDPIYQRCGRTNVDIFVQNGPSTATRQKIGQQDPRR